MTARFSLIELRPIHGIAVDMGSGLGAALRASRGTAALDDDLFAFKRIVAESLSPYATTLLVDSKYGRELLGSIHESCEPMLAYEADVYRISEDDRITVLPDDLNVSDYPALGVRVLKFFLYYGPNDGPELNERKQALVRRIGGECRTVGIEFLFEPIVYHRGIPDASSAEFALMKPALVERATRTFASPEFGVDILKVELPVNLSHVAGLGSPTMSVCEAEAACRNAAEAAGAVPLVYLSAGVTFEQFRAGVQMARRAGVQPAGFMCGRAVWNDAIEVFGSKGPLAAERWMADEGVGRLELLKEALS